MANRKLTEAEWGKMRKEYVEGRGSQRVLAEKYGVTQRALSTRASAEGWTQERDDASSKLRQKRREARERGVTKAAEESEQEGWDWGREQLAFARGLLEKASKQLEAADEPRELVRVGSAGTQAVKILSEVMGQGLMAGDLEGVDPAQLQEYIAALEEQQREERSGEGEGEGEDEEDEALLGVIRRANAGGG